MQNYIAKIKGHQSIIFLANDIKDALEWANYLKEKLYGKCELTELWTGGKRVFYQVDLEEV